MIQKYMTMGCQQSGNNRKTVKLPVPLHIATTLFLLMQLDQ